MPYGMWHAVVQRLRDAGPAVGIRLSGSGVLPHREAPAPKALQVERG